jgi:cytochrome d ubiquinol oxidase subunit I
VDAADPLLLSRIQFGLNIGFHILFPTLTIALGWFLLYFRLRHARSGDAHWMGAYRQWVKIFALTFAMGVVTGITMSFQFGTNWPGFMGTVGNIAGPLLAYEVLVAFFLEATFLGVMLFGMKRVSARVHLFATLMVAIGTTLSAFWIIALNSWMQTPTGQIIADGQFIAGDWIAVIFSPSMPYRLTHVLLSSTLTAAFVIAGLSAWRLLRSATDEVALRALRTAIVVAAVAAPLQVVVGDQHGLNTLEHQPAKVAAMEALWHTEKGAPLVLFGIPNEREQRNDFAIEIPRFASLILTHDLDGEVKGIDHFAPDAPPVAPVFFAFRVMLVVGMAMVALAWLGAWYLRRKGAMPRWLLWAFTAFTFSGWAATLAGWIVTEIGRQPWLVSGLLRTADAVGTISEGQLGASLGAYGFTYAGMLIAYIVVVTHLAGQGAPSTEMHR